MSKVGMVGLGAMGTPMCENLMAAGYQLTVCDSHPGRVEAMVAKGATAAATPAEAASGVDAIVTMVPNDAVLKAVTCDRDTGLLRTFGGGVHVSTVLGQGSILNSLRAAGTHPISSLSGRATWHRYWAAC